MDREGGMVARRHGRGHTVRWNWNKCNLEGPKFCFLDVKNVTKYNKRYKMVLCFFWESLLTRLRWKKDMLKKCLLKDAYKVASLINIQETNYIPL